MCVGWVLAKLILLIISNSSLQNAAFCIVSNAFLETFYCYFCLFVTVAVFLCLLTNILALLQRLQTAKVCY